MLLSANLNLTALQLNKKEHKEVILLNHVKSGKGTVLCCVYLYLSLYPRTIHPAGNVHCVSPDIILRSSGSNHSCHNRTCIDTYRNKETRSYKCQKLSALHKTDTSVSIYCRIFFFLSENVQFPVRCIYKTFIKGNMSYTVGEFNKTWPKSWKWLHINMHFLQMEAHRVQTGWHCVHQAVL